MVAASAKTCPHCGEKNPALTKRQTELTALIALALFAYTAFSIKSCSDEAAKPLQFELTPTGIKSIDQEIDTVEINNDNATLRINHDPLSSGQNDWNYIAAQTAKINRALLTKVQINKISIEYWSPANKFVWAFVRSDRQNLPANWQDLTYLEQFGFTQHSTPTLQINQWLCDFYAKYPSTNHACPP
jgi:hypothetical protein